MRRDPDKHPKLTERYVLGELNESERSAFEEHLFDCDDCAEDVILADSMIEGLRAHGGKKNELSRLSLFWAWLTTAPLRPIGIAAMAACALIVAPLALYQNLVTLPGLRHEIALRDRPLALAAATLRRPTRGTGKALPLTADARALVVAIELPPGARDKSLAAEVRNAAAPLPPAIPSFAVAPPAAGEPLTLRLPTASLAPGAYDLVIEEQPREQNAGGAFELARYPFTIERR